MTCCLQSFFICLSKTMNRDSNFGVYITSLQYFTNHRIPAEDPSEVNKPFAGVGEIISSGYGPYFGNLLMQKPNLF